MVIGVVAVLTVPAMMNNINKNILAKQQTVFQKKFHEGLSRMRVDGKLEDQYSTTQEFVKEMKKYFNITQICEKGNLQNCFVEKFTAEYKEADANGKIQIVDSKVFETAKLTTTRSLAEKSYYDTDIVGLKFSDGTNMLISIKPDCSGAKPGDTQAVLTSCLGYVYDVNNSKTPNTTKEDISTNMYLVKEFKLSFEIIEDKLWTSSDFGYQQGPYWEKDYWLGAQTFCESKGGSLPTQAQLQEIAKHMYKAEYKTDTSTYDSEKVLSTPMYQYLFGIHSGKSSYIWSNEPYNDKLAVFLAPYPTYYALYRTLAGAGRSASYVSAICVK